MENKEDIKKELENLAPKLNKIDVRNDFTLPENYFYSLSDQIQEKVKATGTSKTTTFINLMHSKSVQFSLAFMIFLIIGYGIFNFGRNFYNLRTLKNTILTEEYILENIDPDEMIEFASSQVNIPKNHKNGDSGKIKQRREEAENNLLENIDESIIIDEL